MVKFVKFIAGIFLNIFFKLELVGMKNIPSSGSLLMCANHVSELDMFAMGYKLKRLIRFMAKEELFRTSIMASIMYKLGAFPVKRGKGDVGAIKTSLKLLKDGEIIGIFAEGTRTKNKTKDKVRVNPGVAMLAVKSGAPIIPVAIQGDYKLFSKIRVIFGEPYKIDFVDGKKYSNEELIDISKDIMSRVYSLVEDK